MENKKICIGTARINGLDMGVKYLKEKDSYITGIFFSKTSTMLFKNIPFIKMGDTKNEAEEYYQKFKRSFKQAEINEGDDVAVIFENDGNVIALSGNGKNMWIDVRDKFACKKFKTLEINITSLKVY